MSRFSVIKPALVLVFWTVIAVTFPWKMVDLGLSVLTTQPGYSVHLGGGVDRYWDEQELEGRIENMGWHIEYVWHLRDENVLGLTVPSKHTIFLESTLTWNERYDVLAHEGAHTLQPAWMDKEQGEAWAESVAYLIAGNRQPHARYLASHKMAFLEVWLTETDNIYAAAATLQVQ